MAGQALVPLDGQSHAVHALRVGEVSDRRLRERRRSHTCSRLLASAADRAGHPTALCEQLVRLIEASQPKAANPSKDFRDDDRILRDDPAPTTNLFDHVRPRLPATIGPLRLLGVNDRPRLTAAGPASASRRYGRLAPGGATPHLAAHAADRSERRLRRW